MKKLLLLIAAGSLWLFLAAIPVLADGGPHTVAVNSGGGTLTADSCAGCHRAHTAKGEYLITQASEEALCTSCHGSATTGASTDVLTGVQYAVAGQTSGAILGALRGGGFEDTAIGDPGRVMSSSTRTTMAAFNTKVTVAKSGSNVDNTHATTSAHIVLGTATFTNAHILWGNGANGSGAGPQVTLECTDCHNPHGNGQYRILNPIPKPTGTTNPVSISVAATSAAMDYIVTKTGHPFQAGDLVDIAGLSTQGVADGTYTVVSAPNGVTFQIGSFNNNTQSGFTPIDITADSLGIGTVARSQEVVADSPLRNLNITTGTSDTKNYTVIQKAGVQGDNSTYYLYANDVISAAVPATSGDYWHRQVPWYSKPLNSRITSIASGTYTSLNATSFVVGQRVTVTTNNTSSVSGATYAYATVATVNATTTQFTLTNWQNKYSPTDTPVSAVTPLTDGTWSATTATSWPAVALGAINIVSATASNDQLVTEFTTGLSVGDIVTLAAGVPGVTKGTYQVATISTASGQDTLTLTGANVSSDLTWSGPGAGWPTVNPLVAQQDAPNGQPATNPARSVGAVAFDVQITAWCSGCHTRYMANGNQNSGTDPVPSNGNADIAVSITGQTNGTGTFTGTWPSVNTPGSLSWGDVVTFAGTTTTPSLSGNYYVVQTGSYSSGSRTQTFRVSATYGGSAITFSAGSASGTVTRLYPVASNSWWIPRQTNTAGVVDANYSFQHRTVPDRACTTCHVAHGTSAVMTPAGYSATETWPNGNAPSIANGNSVSRLLKVSNRGTCQSCHDPTNTWGVTYPEQYTGSTNGLTSSAPAGAAPQPGWPLYYNITNRSTQLLIP